MTSWILPDCTHLIFIKASCLHLLSNWRLRQSLWCEGILQTLLCARFLWKIRCFVLLQKLDQVINLTLDDLIVNRRISNWLCHRLGRRILRVDLLKAASVDKQSVFALEFSFATELHTPPLLAPLPSTLCHNATYLHLCIGSDTLMQLTDQRIASQRVHQLRVSQDGLSHCQLHSLQLVGCLLGGLRHSHGCQVHGVVRDGWGAMLDDLRLSMHCRLITEETIIGLQVSYRR